MRVFNEDKTQELFEYDLSKGYLKEEKLFVAHHEEVKEVKQKSHYEVIKEYENGGKDVAEIIDVPYRPYQKAYDEYEDIYVYIHFTEKEQREIDASDQEKVLRYMMFKSQQVSFLNDLPDEQAASIPLCYEPWASFIGNSLSEGIRVEHNGKLWKVRKDIATVLEHQAPSVETASLYECINIEHSGTIDDPIPYDMNMAVSDGLYYTENEILYKCIRDSIQPLYATCESLVGNYFELAQSGA